MYVIISLEHDGSHGFGKAHYGSFPLNQATLLVQLNDEGCVPTP